jgi:hypothetical protein
MRNQTTIYLPPELRAQLARRAKARGLSLSRYLVERLAREVIKEGEQPAGFADREDLRLAADGIAKALEARLRPVLGALDRVNVTLDQFVLMYLQHTAEVSEPAAGAHRRLRQFTAAVEGFLHMMAEERDGHSGITP